MRTKKKSKENNLLTPLELKVMNILWVLKKAFVKEVLEHWPEEAGNEVDKKPAYNTVSTTIRILEKKNYVKHEAFGRTHQYMPIVSKYEYQKRLMANVLQNAFAGSVSSLVSALVDDKEISNDDLEGLQGLIDEHKKDTE